MKRKMVNIMTTMLLISNISMNTVYASPIHLEPAPAPDMSITTETETENNEHNEETNENENLNQKSQKYKIKDVIYLYDSNAENAKKVV